MNKLPRKYRYEYKFIISEIDKQILMTRLSSCIDLDQNVKNGSYNIRSVYFDDIYDTCYFKNESGVDKRAKYRIRIYNNSDEQIMLEKKIKERGMTRKLSTKITREQCDIFLRGENLSLLEKEFASYSKLLQQFCVLISCSQFKPKVIVDYDRIPYVYKIGNVRITFDQNISSSNEFTSFFKEDLKKRPIMPMNTLLLEVKYDGFLPRFIKEMLQMKSLNQTSFSKYYLCRKFEMPNRVRRNT